jgi:beta-glucosidase/6-phospho-beta-glucosidase/beta-galactosidase
MLPWLALFACTSSGDPQIARAFPEGFRMGAATAGFQVDMGCPTRTDCVDTRSDWYAWVTDPRILEEESLYVTGQTVEAGPGMWELFEEDVVRMQADGMRAFRMSLEWSRLFPDAVPDGTPIDEMDALANGSAVARYHAMFAALRNAGIEPVVTVNHYTLPLWVHDGVACHLDPATCTSRGWADPELLVPRIAAFAGWAGREFGADIDRWATLNEPFATTLSGYVQPGESRSAPPGRLLDAQATVASVTGQIEAHAAMFDALHATDATDADADGTPATVGIVMNMVDIQPKDPNREADRLAATHMDFIYHRLFLDGLTSGAWDDNLDGTFDRTRPELADRLDWIGVNYYNLVNVVSVAPFKPLGDAVPLFDFIPEFSWDLHTEGIAVAVARAADYDRPIWVTENGTPDVVNAEGALDAHLGHLWDAIEAGADVRGYLYWSYVDNYEWNHGMDLQFGLYGLDPVTKARLDRPVIARYRTILAQGGLE